MKKTSSAEVIIVLLMLSIVPIYLYGIRPLVIMAVSVIFGVGADALCYKLSHHKNFKKYSFSAVITSLITALLLPATVPYYVVIIAVLVSILIAKYPFGGDGKNIFNPAAVGLAFVTLSFPQQVLSFPLLGQKLDVFSSADYIYTVSPGQSLGLGGVPSLGFMDALLGNFPGAIGATQILVLFFCGVFLVVRKKLNWRLPVLFLITMAVFIAAFPRIPSSSLTAPIYELASGVGIFGSVFMLSDPTTTPKTNKGCYLFGVLLGFITIIFTYYGYFENGFIFALIIMNSLNEACDSGAQKLWDKSALCLQKVRGLKK